MNAAKAKPADSLSPAKGVPRKARKPASLPRSDGDAGVQACIASMEPWQAAIVKRLDALVVKHVPGVRKAVRGTSLTPAPPIGRFKEVRSLDGRESDKLDKQQLASWIEQAASIPGWDGGSPL